jgi:plastocyanin
MLVNLSKKIVLCFLVIALSIGMAVTAMAITNPPSIVSFYADDLVIGKGDSVELKWEVSDAEYVTLSDEDDIIDTFDTEGTFKTKLNSSEKFTLTAHGDGIKIDSQVYVKVDKKAKPAIIKYFEVSPKTITLGERAKLSWSTDNTDQVYIGALDKKVGAAGSLTVTPTSSGKKVYDLIAYDDDGNAISDVVVLNVVPDEDEDVEIVKFEADENVISRGDLVELSWITKNAAGCLLVTSDGLRLMDRMASGKIKVTPNETREYTLIAYGDQQDTVEKTVKIIVK